MRRGTIREIRGISPTRTNKQKISVNHAQNHATFALTRKNSSLSGDYSCDCDTYFCVGTFRLSYTAASKKCNRTLRNNAVTFRDDGLNLNKHTLYIQQKEDIPNGISSKFI